MIWIVMHAEGCVCVCLGFPSPHQQPTQHTAGHAREGVNGIPGGSGGWACSGSNTYGHLLGHTQWRRERYLESRKIKNSKAVEEAQALKSHLDCVVGVALFGARICNRTVEQYTVQHVQHANQVCGPESCRQPRGILTGVIKYAAKPVKENSRKHCRTAR